VASDGELSLQAQDFIQLSLHLNRIFRPCQAVVENQFGAAHPGHAPHFDSLFGRLPAIFEPWF